MEVDRIGEIFMEKTLVVMAAGMGTRFGGLKQIEPVGPNGEFIIDYSIYDAKRAGFTKVVFVIKEELEEVFKETIGKRLEDKIKVEYAFQRIDDIPKLYLRDMREKPWGTVQAVLCTQHVVDGDFVVINADDFYGYDTFRKASQFLNESKSEEEYACITYPFHVTASKYGSVKRGVCFVEGDYIVDIKESNVILEGNEAKAVTLANNEEFRVPAIQPVSMNCFAFKHKFYQYLEEYFMDYFKQDDEVVIEGEILLPELVKEKLEKGEIRLKNITSSGLWFGITYKEDLSELVGSIKTLIEKGEYPNKLWG